jgi:hypothetical protein
MHLWWRLQPGSVLPPWPGCRVRWRSSLCLLAVRQGRRGSCPRVAQWVSRK